MTDTVTPKILTFLPESPFKFALYQKSIHLINLSSTALFLIIPKIWYAHFPIRMTWTRRFIATDFQARFTIRMMQVNPDGLKSIGTDQFVVSGDYMNFLSDYTNNINKCCSSR